VSEENGGAAKHTAILFSGGLSVAEYEGNALQTTIATPETSVVSYVRGPDMGGGVGGLLYSVRSETSGGKKVRYNLSNGRGDIVAQSDEAAVLTWTASYEAYGKRPVETGLNEDKQRANSKDEDPTGYLNEGWRYRDIETGVWLSRDPAGFVDGPNLYAYVKQNPWTGWDPDGLQTAALSSAQATESLRLVYKVTGRNFSPKDLSNPGIAAQISAAATLTLVAVEKHPELIGGDKLAPSGTLLKGGSVYSNARRGTAIPAGTPLDAQQKYAREKDSNPAAGADLNNATNPGGNGARKTQEDVKTYITYVLMEAGGDVAYVGRASGVGTPEQVLKSRLSKGHDVYDSDRTLVPEVIDTQNSADANKGAEKLWYDFYKSKGSPLRNDPQSPPLSDKPSKQESTQRRVESYIDQDINKE